MQHVTWLPEPSYFNYSPRFLLDIEKVSFLQPAYLWIHLFFRTSERERGKREERVEWNMKAFPKNFIVRIRKTAPIFLFIFTYEISKIFIDTSTMNHCKQLLASLEKAMAPHSSTLTWKITWTEEPGRLQSVGSLWIGHDWAISLSLFTFTHWRRKWQPTPVFLPGESQGQGILYGVAESDTLKWLSSSSIQHLKM